MKSPLIWAGGKQNHINKLTPFFPQKFNDYYEPFIGGGSVFLNFGYKGKNCFISDTNKDLINVWKTIQKNPEKLIHRLEKFDGSQRSEYFYRVRDSYNSGEYDRFDKAASFIYMNKRCYGGRFTYTKHEELNSNFSYHKKQPIFNKKNILKTSKRLRKVVIKRQSYDKIQPQDGDFVYLDPPYDESYGLYMKDFDKKDTKTLFKFCKNLDSQGVRWTLSNSDTEYIRDLFSDFRIETIKTKNTFKSWGKEKKNEVVVMNYG